MAPIAKSLAPNESAKLPWLLASENRSRFRCFIPNANEDTMFVRFRNRGSQIASFRAVHCAAAPDRKREFSIVTYSSMIVRNGISCDHSQRMTYRTARFSRRAFAIMIILDKLLYSALNGLDLDESSNSSTLSERSC